MELNRHRFSLCQINNRFLFVVGGRNVSTFQAMDDVERYDCGKDKVCRIPSLNEPRMYLSTCAMGSSIYAICGFNKDEQGESRFLNTFERLDNPGAEEGTEEHEDLEWVTLALAEEINLLTERASTIAVAINT